MKSLVRNSLIAWSRCVFVTGAMVLAFTANAGESFKASVQYHPLSDEQQFGIGFLSDNKTLFVGGCNTLNVERGELEARCRFPENLRWGHVSADGTLLLATTVTPETSVARSYQIDTRTGTIQSSRSGIYFAPPIAIHPNNQFWVAVQAGKSASSSENVSVFNTDWEKVKRGIYMANQRLFSLQFSPGGVQLIANGGDPADGAVLNTINWKAAPVTKGHTTIEGLLAWSRDGRLGFKVAGKTGIVIDVESQDEIARLDIDITTDEPQAAFSPDGSWFAAKGYHLFNGARNYAVGVILIPQRK